MLTNSISIPKGVVARGGSEDGDTEAAVAAGGPQERTQRLRPDGEAAGGGFGGGGCFERRQPAGRAAPLGRHQEQRRVALQVLCTGVG